MYKISTHNIFQKIYNFIMFAKRECCSFNIIQTICLLSAFEANNRAGKNYLFLDTPYWRSGNSPLNFNSISILICHIAPVRSNEAWKSSASENRYHACQMECSVRLYHFGVHLISLDALVTSQVLTLTLVMSAH